MKWLRFLSICTIGLYIGSVSASDTVKDQDDLLFKCVIVPATTKSQDDPHLKYTEYAYIFDSSKYASLSFATRRTRVTRDNAGIGVLLIADAVKTCENNTELKDSISNMSTCIKLKPVVATPRNEFIENLETCSTKTRQLLKKCMPEKLKYLPEVIFPLAVSSSKLVYDDFTEISKLALCVPELASSKSEKYYKECVANTTPTSDKIPGSKKIFCKKFVAVSECYVKQINNTCTFDSDIEKFTKDYLEAMKEPCLDELE